MIKSSLNWKLSIPLNKGQKSMPAWNSTTRAAMRSNALSIISPSSPHACVLKAKGEQL